ncbi:hypothetical protein EBS02_11785, partial [bacterium]|nr:hypothetical protein [bacterium]
MIIKLYILLQKTKTMSSFQALVLASKTDPLNKKQTKASVIPTTQPAAPSPAPKVQRTRNNPAETTRALLKGSIEFKSIPVFILLISFYTIYSLVLQYETIPNYLFQLSTAEIQGRENEIIFKILLSFFS